MKKITILFLIIFSGYILKAQQLPQFTQYMINDYVFNPAIAGCKDYYQIKTNIRNQWVGIVDAPRTTVLSVYGNYKDKNIGLGGVVFNDQVGATNRTGLSLSYAYHFSLTDDMKLSMALSGGFTQFKIDKTDIIVKDPNDPLFMQGDVFTSSVPDATFGFHLYTEKWFVGASMPQLLNSKLGLLDEDVQDKLNIETEGSLDRHYYMLAGYRWKVNYDYLVEPSLLLKNVAVAPMQLDIGVKATYQDKLWFGTLYRTSGDMALLLGYTIGERFLVGYSYDIVTSGLGEYTSGSHEFMLGIRFHPAVSE